MININRAEKTSNYTIISNAVLQNADLSLEARGALCSLISMPKDWIIIKKHLRRMFNCGMDKINSVFDELKDAGYLIQVMDADGKPAVQRDENGRFLGHVYKVYENPADAPATNTPPQASPPEKSGPSQYCGFRQRATGRGFSRAGNTGGGSTATVNPHLQSTYKATKNTENKEHREQNKHTHKPAHARTPAAGQKPASAFGGGVDIDLSDTGVHEVDEVADREGVEFSVKERKQDTGPAEALLTQWGGINMRAPIAQANPKRIARAMLYVAECLSKPDHGIRDKNRLLASIVDSQDQPPPPDSATAPSPEYAWLWDAAADLGIIDPQPDDQPPQDKPLPPWMQRKPQLDTTIPAHAAEALAECKSMLEAEYDLRTYNTCLKDIQCIAYDEATHTYTLTTRRTEAHDMLTQRLHAKIERTLSSAAGQPVTVRWQRWQDATADTKQPALAAV